VARRIINRFANATSLERELARYECKLELVKISGEKLTDEYLSKFPLRRRIAIPRVAMLGHCALRRLWGAAQTGVE
jgi:hypothetical protein